ncbi:hypothetical protein HMP09_1939 [Sphingomonas sp. HMP9]|nr:hypothetical protein HMP09_1939 [Sphingomonas sp. HMP9]
MPDTLPNETSNGNASLASIFTSREFLGLRSTSLAPFGLLSIYGPDSYVGVINPTDNRTVNVDFTPTYFADEEQYTAKFYHNFGKIKLNFTGGYTRNSVDAQTDYNLAVENSLINNSGLIALDALGRPGGRAAFLNGVRTTLIPNGPNGGLCQSAADSNNVGIYGGHGIGCFPQSIDFDRARQANRQYSAEAHIDSSFDGPFNFLFGGIYVDHKITQNDTFINAFGLDYASGILGGASSQAIPEINGNAFLATPFFRNDSDEFHLKSYGIFGEGYVAINDKLKLTLGLRYNHDAKSINQRNLLLSVLTPIGTTSIEDGPNYAAADYDTTTPGIQKYSVRSVAFSRLTGRAVLDYKITRDNLLYVSYSRGYKSGGINPALPANVNFTQTFNPEKVDAFEIGSKNSFANGKLRLNLTGFYYKYNGLQLARLVNRTSVNDNINVNIYGVEAEAIMRPVPAFLVNINASYQRSKVSDDKLLINTRDPSGGRSDAVIIKDITNASNCVVTSTTPGNAAAANQYVAAVNGGIGLRAPVAIPSTTTTGTFGVCSVLASTAANPSTGLRALFATPTGALPFTVADGIPVNLRGNELPQAPTYKFSVGAQYTIDFRNGMSLVPRADLNYTGNYTASIFNGNIDRVRGYEVVNMQIQLNGRDDRWYLRGFVQNLTANDAVTGQFTADQSAGLFTNIFTIEPRRYGVAAGFKF